MESIELDRVAERLAERSALHLLPSRHVDAAHIAPRCPIEQIFMYQLDWYSKGHTHVPRQLLSHSCSSNHSAPANSWSVLATGPVGPGSRSSRSSRFSRSCLSPGQQPDGVLYIGELLSAAFPQYGTDLGGGEALNLVIRLKPNFAQASQSARPARPRTLQLLSGSGYRWPRLPSGTRWRTPLQQSSTPTRRCCSFRTRQ
jgi:hypothetical protein